MEGNFFQSQGVKNKYRYNGIEFNEELGVDLSFATYRTLDAAVGRWLQVDPKAETLYGMTPYNSMGNNPILHSDPNGDVLPALVVAAIALAAVNGTMNVVGQALQGNVTSFWQGLEYFGVGAISGAVTIFNPVLGRVINAGGNKIVQLANGQWSPTDIDSGKDVLFLAVDVGLDLLQPGMSNGLAKPIASSINRAIEKKAYEAFVKSLGKDAITSSWKGGFKVLGGTVELTSKAVAKGGTTVLGHYPAYTKLASKLGASRFQIPTNVWNKMSAAEQWIANTKFLDRMILRGDNIRLATPLSKVKPGSFFQKELNYLFSKGYKVDGLWLVK